MIPGNAVPQVKESLFCDGWTLNVGPGAAGKLEIGDGRIRVDADFREGGYYIAVERKLPVPINLDGLHFTVKGISGRIALIPAGRFISIFSMYLPRTAVQLQFRCL